MDPPAPDLPHIPPRPVKRSSIYDVFNLFNYARDGVREANDSFFSLRRYMP